MTAKVIYIVINLLFVLKYSLRLGYVAASVACGCYMIFAGLLLYCLPRLPQIKLRWTVVGTGIMLTLLTLGQCMIDPYTLQVDRWSAIHNFIANLLAGEYPYAAMTHLGGYGSPFPVWQVFHISFYLFGNVGLSFLAVSIFFFWTVYRLLGSRIFLNTVLLLLLSPAYGYEVMVRSDLMTNFLLVLTIINLIEIKGGATKMMERNPWLVAIIGGLTMSSRLSAVIPLIIYFWQAYMKAGWQRQVSIPLMSLVIFTLTFLPFLLWNGEMLLFFQYSPFVLQSRQGHLSDFLLFIPATVVLASTWRNYDFFLKHAAYTLLLLVVVTFMHNMWLWDNWTALFEPVYDISYFNQALPFLILSVGIGSKSLCQDSVIN